MRPSHVPLEPGHKIHHFTVLKLSHIDHRSRRHYLCRCRCGVEKVVQRSLLSSGNTKSCGCWAKESARSRALPHGEASRNLCFAGYRHKANKANVKFQLTKDQFGRIASKPCFYCGRPPENVCKSLHGTGDFVYSGIDRIEPRNGYTVSNTVPCCHICNFAKSDHSQGAFISWIRQAYTHLSKTAMASQWTNVP